MKSTALCCSFLFLLFVCCVFSQGYAIKCNSCQAQSGIPGSGNPDGCKNPTQVTCNAPYDRCMTLRTTTQMSLGPIVMTMNMEMRNCTVSFMCNEAAKKQMCVNVTGGLKSCDFSCCEGDLCNNGGSGPKPTTIRPKPTTIKPKNVASDNATTSAPVKATEASKSHIVVKCTSDYMEAKVDRKRMSNLDASDLHLNDESCKATEVTDDFITFRVPLDGCGTTHNVSSDGDYLVYYNSVTGDLIAPTTHPLITREHTAEMPFQCSYDRRVVLTRHAYTPRRARVYTRTESFGNFTFTMDMYKTDEYKEKEEYPADTAIGKPLYLEVTVETNDSALAVVPVMCHATPTKGYDDKPQYVFINESCGQDDTLEYKYKEGSVQRFSMDAFRFLPDYKEVYLHCRVVACPQGESDSRCAVGCKSGGGGKTRRRRAATLVRDIEQDLTLGPVKRRERQSSSAQIASSGSMITMVTVIAAVLGFLVLSLIVAVFIVLKRKQTNNGATLLVQDEA